MTVHVVTAPPGIEFRTVPNRYRPIRAIRVARADQAVLADYLDQRYDLNGEGDLSQRLAAAITALTDRGEIKIQYISNGGVFASFCRRAGIRYQRFWFDTVRWRRVNRCVPLFRAVEPNGFLRILCLELDEPKDDDPDAAPGLTVRKEFSDPAAASPRQDADTGYYNQVSIDYAELPALADLLEPQSRVSGAVRPDERAEALITALVAAGDLGPHLPPGVNRERLAERCRSSGIRPRLDGMPRRHEILRAGDLLLRLRFPDHEPALIEFTEAYPCGDLDSRGTRYRLTVPGHAAPALAEQFEQRLGLPTGPGRTDDRLIACFDALATQGHLHAGLPKQGNRAVVAAWIAAAGVTPTLDGFAREEDLISVYRESNDSDYRLTLTMDATQPGTRGIVFCEYYEYLPQPGDAGREYGYYVRTPYASLPALVAHLETEPGEGDLEERLVRCFRQLIARGELHERMGIEQATHLVAARFAEAGVPVERDFSLWVNSE